MFKNAIGTKHERKIGGITIRQRNVKRTVITSIGELSCDCTYFKLSDASMAYLTDQLIGIEPFERVTKDLYAELIQNAASMSMQKAVNVTGAAVRRQSVNNKILFMKNIVT